MSDGDACGVEDLRDGRMDDRSCGAFRNGVGGAGCVECDGVGPCMILIKIGLERPGGNS